MSTKNELLDQKDWTIDCYEDDDDDNDDSDGVDCDAENARVKAALETY